MAFGSVMFDLGGIGIVVSDPYPASPSMKPVTFFPYLLGGGGGEVVENPLLSPTPMIPFSLIRFDTLSVRFHGLSANLRQRGHGSFGGNKIEFDLLSLAA